MESEKPSLPKLYHILCSNLFFCIFLLLSLCFWFYSITRPIPDSFNEGDTQVYGTVKKVKQKEKTIEVWMKESGKSNLRIFLHQSSSVQIGDKIVATGKFSRPQNNTIPNGFNYKYYLWYHREKVIFQADEIEVIGRSKNIFLNFKRNLTSIISKRKNKDYLFLFILGDSSKMEDDDREGFQINGISHLFSISGMHFSLLIGVISHLVLKNRKNNFCSFLFLNLFLFGYLSLIDFIPSACRAFLFWEFVTISKYLKLGWSEIRCFFWMIIMILSWKPFYLFDVGFQFSAVLSFFLCEGKSLFQNQRTFHQSLYFSIFAFSVSLPIVLYYYFSVNFLSIIWNLILVPFVTTIFFPIQLLSFFLPPLSSIGYLLGECFEGFSRFLQSLDFLTFTFHKPPIGWILLYYIDLLLSLKLRRKKVAGVLVLLLTFLYHWNFLIPQSYFLMIDVGQGDSLLIHSNNQTMLVDTGGNYFQEPGTIYKNKLKPLLDSLGIRKLDILCLTHGDYDHLGESLSLIKEIPVKKVYFNEGKTTKEEKLLKEELDKKRISYDTLKEKDFFQIGKFTFFSLNKGRASENASSIVLLGKINQYSFLLMGDATIESEKGIIEKYQIPELLFFKVGHHGSKTSTSLKFLQEITPQYALISVGENNFYGHPSPKVVNHLEENVKSVYMTSKEGSIFIKFQKNVTFSLFSP